MRALVITLATALAFAAPATAQGPPRTRQNVERLVRQRFAEVVQRELSLDDAGMRRLQTTVQKFDQPRRELMRRENQTRRDLRIELRPDGTPSQERVGGLLDELLAVQKQRIELHEQEDRELRTFLTPVQRARYFGLREQLRRRVEEMQQKRGGPPPGAGKFNRRPPPG